MRAHKAALDAAAAQLSILQRQLLHGNIGGGVDVLTDEMKARLQQQIDAQTGVVNDAQATFGVSNTAYLDAVAADSMQSLDAGLPLVLLPVRIETAYLPKAEGMDLAIRVYPDDIHVDTHETELTADELASGTAYWRAVWGAGPNQARLDNAWATLLTQLKPTRAAWSVRALRPSVPRPAEETPTGQSQPEPPLASVGMRPSTFSRPAQTKLLPDRWRIIGLNNHGIELFYVEGAPIPDTLDVSFAPPPPAAERGASSPDAGLPFHEGSRWLANLDAAIAVGMAVRVPLTGPDFRVGQLFVLGTSNSVSPSKSAERLQSAFLAHQYTNGLAFLPPGSPTNNTAKTRSAWQSAPPIPSPSDLESARAAYDVASKQNAALAARALGIKGEDVLSVAPEGLADQQSDVTNLQQFLWPALGGKALSWIYTRLNGTWTKNIDFLFAEALQDHANQFVRSRGILPVMRVGNQPYGILPALLLDELVLSPPVITDGALSPLIPWLRTLRSYWLTSVGPSLPVPEGGDPDSTLVDILKRLPVSGDIKVRPETDPLFNKISGDQLALAAPIPGLPANSELSLALPAPGIPPSLPVNVVHDRLADRELLLTYQELLHDGIDVLEQKMTSEEFKVKHQALIASNTVPNKPPADLFNSLVLDAFNDPLDNNFLEPIGGANQAFFILFGAQFFNPADPESLKSVSEKLPAAKAFVDSFDLLCTVNPDQYEALTRETLDVFSHRLDAWITSLAASRLDFIRDMNPSGLMLGAYGWVENIAPRTAVPDQYYIHAPSMGHAATAAVLRAGYESHNNSGPLAVNLTSSRVRNADWLAAGVRGGQPLGALLGYRFERGLHDNQLDRIIFTLRVKHPLPLPRAPDGIQNADASQEAIAARNVVDGLDLSRRKAAVLGELAAAAAADKGPALTKAETDILSGLLDDLANVLDSFGDLLLAETVHHLVSGNPLRAGLTADTAGRGEPVPDRFDVTITPRIGRPITWHIGALMPPEFRSSSSGWRSERPRATVEPSVNAWAATVLGNAGSWLISCTLTNAAGVASKSIGLDALQLCALDVIAESSGAPSQLELRIVEAVSKGQPPDTAVSVLTAPNPDGTPGFGELLSLAERLRAVLGKATPLSSQHFQVADTSFVMGLDVADLDGRAGAFANSFNAAVNTLRTAAQVLDAAAGLDKATVLTAVPSLRSALIGVADHGIPAAWPVAATTDDSSVSALRAQASSLLTSLQSLATAVRPPQPAADAAISQLTAWVKATAEYVGGIAGTSILLLPVYRLPAGSPYAGAFAAGAAPGGADFSAVMVWLRRLSRIRPQIAAFHDVLLAVEAFDSTRPGIAVAQLPTESGANWAALPFPEGKPTKARISLVLSTPAAIDPAAPFCGFVCDTWTERLPGATTVAYGERGYEASEVTGMAFKADTPDATAPQAVLLALAPDPAKGWSFDVLFDTVKETLELAKIRTVDSGDLLRLGRILPAIHSSSFVDEMLADAAAQKTAGGNT
jgi:hypothetical protein